MKKWFRSKTALEILIFFKRMKPPARRRRAGDFSERKNTRKPYQSWKIEGRTAHQTSQKEKRNTKIKNIFKNYEKTGSGQKQHWKYLSSLKERTRAPQARGGFCNWFLVTHGLEWAA